jgi:predicted RNase H-like nuclease
MGAGRLVIGLDATRNLGWVGILLCDGRFHSAEVFARLADATGRTELACIGVDIPVLHDDAERSLVDKAARKLVGRRGSSVFTTPQLAVFEKAKSRAEADAMSREAGFGGVGSQAFGLRANILQALEIRDDVRVHEVHPEVSFRAMASEHLPHPKKSWAGQRLRSRLLADRGVALPDDLGPANRVPVGDVLDAAVVAWTADRIARGVATRLPDDRPDSLDAIWY